MVSLLVVSTALALPSLRDTKKRPDMGLLYVWDVFYHSQSSKGFGAEACSTPAPATANCTGAFGVGDCLQVVPEETSAQS